MISASNTPTFKPCLRASLASIAETEDLPTPPLPLITATTRLTLLNFFKSGKCGLIVSKSFLRSSLLICPNSIFTPLTSGMDDKTSFAWSAIWSRMGQPSTVNVNVKEAVPSCNFRSRTMPSSTIFFPSSGSITWRSASVSVCSVVIKSLRYFIIKFFCTQQYLLVWYEMCNPDINAS